MKQKILLMALIFLSLTALAQKEKIIVTQTTVKVGSMSTKKLFFGFAEGDKVKINFEVVKGRNLKEFEIFKYPNTSIFMDYKTKKIKNKTINISETGVYKFTLKNSALGVRICRITIERTPTKPEYKNFNTTVYWKTFSNRSYYYVNERYLISRDTTIINIVNTNVKVHSKTNMNDNKTTFSFALPKNTISWSYYIGVDQSGKEVYEKATKELAEKAAPLVAKINGYGPLAALALGGIPYLYQLQTGEDIDFYIVEGQNVNLFLAGQPFYAIKNGKVINDFGRITSPLQGNLYFCFKNDNAVTGVIVTVKVVAVTVNDKWGMRKVKKYKLNTWKEPYLEN